MVCIIGVLHTIRDFPYVECINFIFFIISTSNSVIFQYMRVRRIILIIVMAMNNIEWNNM
jgi:hypothetical protein